MLLKIFWVTLSYFTRVLLILFLFAEWSYIFEVEYVYFITENVILIASELKNTNYFNDAVQSIRAYKAYLIKHIIIALVIYYINIQTLIL